MVIDLTGQDRPKIEEGRGPAVPKLLVLSVVVTIALALGLLLGRRRAKAGATPATNSSIPPHR